MQALVLCDRACRQLDGNLTVDLCELNVDHACFALSQLFSLEAIDSDSMGESNFLTSAVDAEHVIWVFKIQMRVELVVCLSKDASLMVRFLHVEVELDCFSRLFVAH